ncbi:MAG: MlaD family protein [Chitinophagales bacterium]
MDAQRKHNVRLGIFIFIGLVFFVVGIMAIGNINKAFTKTIVVSTEFKDVSGLQPGDNVWFSGVKVGTVKDLRFLENADVEVDMKIEKKSQEYIHKNAKAKISTDGLIGNNIIVIYGGSAEVAHIESGDKLAVENLYTTEDMMNTLQENNKNLLEITNDFKLITKKIVDGEGTLGKLLTDDTMYDQINLTINTLRAASENAVKLTASVNQFTMKLNTEGNLANDIVTDTTVFNSIQASVAQLNEITKTALDVANNLKTTTNDLNTNKNSPAGVLLHDEAAAESLRSSIENLESSTKKLNESMEALQHNFLLRGFFKKKAKEEEKESN